jgi:hypothetical protein
MQDYCNAPSPRREGTVDAWEGYGRVIKPCVPAWAWATREKPGWDALLALNTHDAHEPTTIRSEQIVSFTAGDFWLAEIFPKLSLLGLRQETKRRLPASLSPRSRRARRSMSDDSMSDEDDDGSSSDEGGLLRTHEVIDLEKES